MHPSKGIGAVREGRGYVAALLGALVGGLALGYAGSLLAGAYVRFADPAASQGFRDLAASLVGSLVGAWVGEVGGCWVALRLARHRLAGRTALILAALFVVLVPGTVVVLGRVSSGAVAPGVLVALAVAPLLARAAALRTG